MLLRSAALKLYKRKDIQEAIVLHAANKEIAVKYGDKGFGKRPDMLVYPNDVFEMAKQGATSFHASEELWNNPLQIDVSLPRQELDAMRKGWDLVIDIDCPVWELSKITTYLIVKSLQAHGIKSLSVKFSGNKGFHVGVPFEAFPPIVDTKETRARFPEIARRIALYILEYISREYIQVQPTSIVFGSEFTYSLTDLQRLTGKSLDVLTYSYCTRCGRTVESRTEAKSMTQVTSDDLDFMDLARAPSASPGQPNRNSCSCPSPQRVRRFDPKSIIDIDTILISSRHLYRMPYSLHEKSLLVSVPIDPDSLMGFEKTMAQPDTVDPSRGFMDRAVTQPGEATNLLREALDFTREDSPDVKEEQVVEIPEIAIPEQFFPPCVKLGFEGLGDGRKRFLFILLNFLSSVGWSHEQIEQRVNEWNTHNQEPLRETITLGQLRYRKDRRTTVLPPNCKNMMYYVDLGICKPDNLCSMIRNPVQYAKRKTRYLNKAADKD